MKVEDIKKMIEYNLEIIKNNRNIYPVKITPEVGFEFKIENEDNKIVIYLNGKRFVDIEENNLIVTETEDSKKLRRSILNKLFSILERLSSFV
jgi:uncharacterized protein YxjI